MTSRGDSMPSPKRGYRMTTQPSVEDIALALRLQGYRELPGPSDKARQFAISGNEVSFWVSQDGTVRMGKRPTGRMLTEHAVRLLIYRAAERVDDAGYFAYACDLMGYGEHTFASHNNNGAT